MFIISNLQKQKNAGDSMETQRFVCIFDFCSDFILAMWFSLKKVLCLSEKQPYKKSTRNVACRTDLRERQAKP